MSQKPTKNNRSFAERHPRWNLVIGIVLLFLLLGLAGYIVSEIIYLIGEGIHRIITLLSTIASKLDAVVIVALINQSLLNT